MTDQTGRSVDRRTVLGSLGGLAAAGLLAGCTTSTDGGSPTDGGQSGGGGGGNGGGGSETPTETAATDSGPSYDKATVDGYLSDVGNYDGTVADERGSSSVTVAVGAEGNGGPYAFDPPAVLVDAGTTVSFEWTGNQQHNVVNEGGDYESELYREAGVHFERTFDSTGVSRYYCQPHKGLGMKGVVVV